MAYAVTVSWCETTWDEKLGKKKYIFCPLVTLLVYVISSRRLETTLMGLAGEHGKGILVPRRTSAILGRTEVFQLGNFHLGEGLMEKSHYCPCHNALLTQW